MTLQRMIRGTLLLLLLLCGCMLQADAQYTGVAPTSTPALNVRHPLTTDPAILYPPQRDFILMPADLINVTVYGVMPPYLDVERVSLDGTVRLPLVGVVHLAGLTLNDAEKHIAQLMEEKQVFHDAQVGITVSESPNHIVTVAGAVQKTVPLVGQRTLLDVLSLAGGLPPTASTVIQINRPGLAEPIYVDLGNDPQHSTMANIPIFDGDVITTGTVGQVFVVGAVLNPGVHPLSGSRPVRVSQALAMSGGVSGFARKNDSWLVRTVGDTHTVIPLHLKQIQKGEEPDIVLQSDDVIMVPTNAFKAAFRGTSAATLISLAFAAVAILR